MATRIRLQRNGRKGYAFYSIVIADVRAPRDGRFTEKIGTYNPNTNPATVDLNFDRALYWVNCGAQPTDTVRNILSKEGVYMMKHLLGGVKKGAFDMATAEAKFEAWKKEKLNKIQAKISKLASESEAAYKAEVTGAVRKNIPDGSGLAPGNLWLLPVWSFQAWESLPPEIPLPQKTGASKSSPGFSASGFFEDPVF